VPTDGDSLSGFNDHCCITKPRGICSPREWPQLGANQQMGHTSDSAHLLQLSCTISSHNELEHPPSAAVRGRKFTCLTQIECTASCQQQPLKTHLLAKAMSRDPAAGNLT